MNDFPGLLKAIERRDLDAPARRGGFPWSLPLFAGLRSLSFRKPVTFLVGENGSGKSTLLEALAVGMSAVAAGSRDLDRDETLAPARELAGGFRFSRARHARVRLFLRAEDVFGFTRRVESEMHSLREIEATLEAELPEGLGKRIALGATRSQRAAMSRAYGEDPHARSHGETFLSVLHERIVPQGLYFLDEPETPLSPQRVLSLLSLLRAMAGQGCQFVVATHSPILMALPEADILVLENGRIERTAFEEVEHVRLTRDFLAAPSRYLRHL